MLDRPYEFVVKDRPLGIRRVTFELITGSSVSTVSIMVVAGWCIKVRESILLNPSQKILNLGIGLHVIATKL